MSLNPPISLPKFDNTLGALLIGGLVAMALWGVTCVQTYTYYTIGSKDRLIFKCMIAFLWVVDTFDSALNAHFLYYYMVTNYLNPLALTKPIWSVVLHVALTSLINFIIRILFCLRVWRLSKGNLFATVWILSISLTDLVIGVVITVKGFGLTSFANLDSIQYLMYFNFVTGTLSDTSVTVALSIILRRSRTGFRRTDSLIQTLIVYAVNTGALVAITASLGLILYIAMPHNFIFLAPYLQVTKLYLNSYLAVLNARGKLRDMNNESEHFSVHLSQLSQPRSIGSPVTSKMARPNMEVSVHTFVDQKVDSHHMEPTPARERMYLPG